MTTAERSWGNGVRLPRTVAFWLLATSLGVLLFAASAPSPLYSVYQSEWHFSTLTLTIVYAVYALALLVALIFAGSLSDQVGRRPVLLVALAVQVAGMLAFAFAGGVAWLYVARILQGLGTGLATGAISAALFDLQPARHPRLGALVGSVAPSVGLALGGLGAGLLVQYAPAPTRLVYWLLVAVFAGSILGVLTMPETVARHDATRWFAALRPHAGVPPNATAAFATIAPCLVAFWALSGLYLSLGPSMVRTLLHDQNRLAGGVVIFALAAAGALASTLTQSWRPPVAMIAGCVGLMAGVVVTLVAVADESLGLFYAGSVVAGLGFGPAFTGVFRALTALVGSDERAGMIASIYVVSYLAYSLPAVAAGLAAPQVGLRTTADVYGVTVIVLAAVAVVAFVAQGRHRTARAAPTPYHDAPPCPGTVASPCMPAQATTG